MAKIALVSDLHLSHWKRTGGGRGADKLTDRIANWVFDHQPDILIDAGDTELPHLLEAKLLNRVPYVRINGNHDYYGKTWLGPHTDTQVIKLDNLPKIAMATLWTNCNDGDADTIHSIRHGMNDYSQILGFSPEKSMDAFFEHKTFLEDNYDCPVVVTHHAPSLKSVDPKYAGDSLNYAFVSNLDDFILHHKPKLWLHGHIHSHFDYKIGETRVVCHPCGYPHESREAYVPLMVEI